MSTDDERQHVVRLPGARRAKLTPAPGTTAEPVAADDVEDDPAAGANDERMRRDKPPHY